MNIYNELYELVLSLYQLGHSYPSLLFSLSLWSDPSFPQHNLPATLTQLFVDVPRYLISLPPSLSFSLSPLLESTAFKLLLNIHNVSCMFNQMTYLLILHLSNSLSPFSASSFATSPLTHILEVMLLAQTQIKNLNPLSRSLLHEQMSKYSENKRLLELLPTLHSCLVPLFLDLLKLPKQEWLNFCTFFPTLPKEQVYIFIQIFQSNTETLLLLKSNLTSSSVVYSSSLTTLPISPTPSSMSSSPPYHSHTPSFYQPFPLTPSSSPPPQIHGERPLFTPPPFSSQGTLKRSREGELRALKESEGESVKEGGIKILKQGENPLFVEVGMVGAVNNEDFSNEIFRGYLFFSLLFFFFFFFFFFLMKNIN
jgi:hypothetical protein